MKAIKFALTKCPTYHVPVRCGCNHVSWYVRGGLWNVVENFKCSDCGEINRPDKIPELIVVGKRK